MREYTSMMLNVIKYADTYQSAEYARILNVSDVVHSIRSLSSYRDD